MTKEQFLHELTEELELESTISLKTNIKQLDEWDSMTAMLLIGYVSSNFDITLTGKDIDQIDTFESLVQKIGADKFFD